MSREVPSIVKQLIVLEQLLCRVVRLHALRTDEALNTETHHHINYMTVTHWSASILQLCFQGSKSCQLIKNKALTLPQMSDRG